MPEYRPSLESSVRELMMTPPQNVDVQRVRNTIRNLLTSCLNQPTESQRFEQLADQLRVKFFQEPDLAVHWANLGNSYFRDNQYDRANDALARSFDLQFNRNAVIGEQAFVILPLLHIFRVQQRIDEYSSLIDFALEARIRDFEQHRAAFDNHLSSIVVESARMRNWEVFEHQYHQLTTTENLSAQEWMNANNGIAEIIHSCMQSGDWEEAFYLLDRMDPQHPQVLEIRLHISHASLQEFKTTEVESLLDDPTMGNDPRIFELIGEFLTQLPARVRHPLAHKCLQKLQRLGIQLPHVVALFQQQELERQALEKSKRVIPQISPEVRKSQALQRAAGTILANLHRGHLELLIEELMQDHLAGPELLKVLKNKLIECRPALTLECTAVYKLKPSEQREIITRQWFSVAIRCIESTSKPRLQSRRIAAQNPLDVAMNLTSAYLEETGYREADIIFFSWLIPLVASMMKDIDRVAAENVLQKGREITAGDQNMQTTLSELFDYS